jgi:hypothetical protein
LRRGQAGGDGPQQHQAERGDPEELGPGEGGRRQEPAVRALGQANAEGRVLGQVEAGHGQGDPGQRAAAGAQAVQPVERHQQPGCPGEAAAVDPDVEQVPPQGGRHRRDLGRGQRGGAVTHQPLGPRRAAHQLETDDAAAYALVGQAET